MIAQTSAPATVYTFETYTCPDCGESTSNLAGKTHGTVRCLDCDYAETVARFPEFFPADGLADLEQRAGESAWLDDAVTYGRPEAVLA
jgi:hypothetical protein